MELPQIPKSKTLAFLFFGVVLYLGSTYLNILQSGSANIGVYLGFVLTVVGAAAQIVNWLIYWQKPSE